MKQEILVQLIFPNRDIYAENEVERGFNKGSQISAQ